MRIAINGFGRIGRLILRAFLEARHRDPLIYPTLEFVAINDLMDAATAMHLLAFDTVHGPLGRVYDEGYESFSGLPAGFTYTLDALSFPDLPPIHWLSIADPLQCPWKELKVDLVLECSGFFTTRSKAQRHLDAGAHRVLISAPAEDPDITVAYGVNDKALNPTDLIISNGSCTTNCLAPLAKALLETVGIKNGFMTTVHAYTGDQRLQDAPHKDLHRARAAGASMIPAQTGAAKALGLVLPELVGKLDGTAIRVPTLDVSLIDLTFVSASPTDRARLNRSIEDVRSKDSKLATVLHTVNHPAVSVDFVHSRASSIVDLGQTQVVGDTFCRMLAWYDNEWGFSNRMLDVSRRISEF